MEKIQSPRRSRGCLECFQGLNDCLRWLQRTAGSPAAQWSSVGNQVTRSAPVECHRLLLLNLLVRPFEYCEIYFNDTRWLSVENVIAINSGSDNLYVSTACKRTVLPLRLSGTDQQNHWQSMRGYMVRRQHAYRVQADSMHGSGRKVAGR
jgi:hypothetical protein